VRAALAAPFESLGTLLSSHRAIARVSIAAVSFTLIIAFSQQATMTQAGPEAAPVIPDSLLPQNVGVGIPTDDAVTINFRSSMNPGSVEDALQVLPAQAVELDWSEDLAQLTVSPERRWRTDETYIVVVGAPAAGTDGQALTGALRYAFTTATAPTVSDFQVRLVDGDPSSTPLDTDEQALAQAALETDAVIDSTADAHDPANTAEDVSASSTITIGFSSAMDQRDVEQHFAISPAVDGELTWSGNDLVFHPVERLEPGSRYTISVVGSHDANGNPIGGKGNFSFIVQSGAQVTKTEPEPEAVGVEPEAVSIWFSQPMDTNATNKAFALTDTTLEAKVAGDLKWNDARTHVTFTPDGALAAGHAFAAAFEGGARDADGNKIDASVTFTTKEAPVVAATRAPTSVRSTTPAPPAPVAAAPAPPPAPAPAVPAAAPASSLAGYALNQVNAARAAYGFGPVVLDSAVSAAASAHAWDQARNGYFSHTGLNGSTRETRLRAAGVGFGWSGENQCYHIGMSQQATLNWCHQQFMSEPYPGHFNHIANILNPNARRMGVGIATVGGKTVITWNFTD
jgi:uncharacterized protein YkwD